MLNHGPVAARAPGVSGRSGDGSGAPSALRIEIADPVVTVEPGGDAATTVTVRNLGDRVEDLAIGVVGPVAEFGAVAPPSVRVYPGATATCALRFAPPRSAACPAGRFGYGVRARSDGHQVAAGATVVVSAYTDLSAELAPETAPARLRSVRSLILTNQGNTVQRVQLRATDLARALRFDLPRPLLDLPPGQVTVPVGVRARPAVAGASARHPFEVAVVDAGGATLARAAGTRTTPAWVPSWLAAVLAVLAALALLGSGLKAAATAGGGVAAGPGPAPGAPANGRATRPPAPGAVRDTVAVGSRWVRPVPGPVVSGFRSAGRPEHDGVDIGAGRGTVIRAASAGVVMTVLCNVDGRFFAPDTGPVPCDSDGSPGLGGCGWYVEVRHAGRVLSRYCHLVRQPAVRVGQAVAVGQPIGFVGTSGNSSGPHLHLEIHLRAGEDAEQPVDPVPFLARQGVRL